MYLTPSHPQPGWKRLRDGSPEQVAPGRRWAETRKPTGADLQPMDHRELRQLDRYRAIASLRSTAHYTRPPRAFRLGPGVVEQQRWFMPAASHESACPE
jgi:hypothetical protein